MAIQTTANAFQAGNPGELDIQIDGYDKYFGWVLKSLPVYRQFVKQFPISPTNQSRTYHLPKWQFLPRGDRTLDEVNDPASLALPEALDVPVTLVERGAWIEVSYRLQRGDATYVGIDESKATQLAEDAKDTLDDVVRDVFLGASNVMYSDAGNLGGTGFDETDIEAGDKLTAKLVRRAVASLRAGSVKSLKGDKYVGIIHPTAAVGFREDVGAVSWGAPHVNVDTSAIYNGYVGTFEGVNFLETPRAFSDEDGSADHEVFRTLIFGAEAVAEAVKMAPTTGVSPVTDKLDRHEGLYWKSDLGHALYRDEAVRLIMHSAE